MGDWGIYGEMAARHMARWRPSDWAAIRPEDRARYFQALNEEVLEEIEARERSLAPPASLQQTNFVEYVGQVRMARLMAEEEVLARLVYLPPEPGLESEADEEPEPSSEWDLVSPDWLVNQLSEEELPLEGPVLRPNPEGESSS